MRPVSVYANLACPAGCPCDVLGALHGPHRRSKIVQRWLRKHPRLRVLHGARYSPHDNPIERIWGALKTHLANSPTLTIQGRIRQVHAFFRARTSGQLLATAAPSSSPWLPEGYMQNHRQIA
jgi:hypothetical protein